jgi:hypothetical protein
MGINGKLCSFHGRVKSGFLEMMQKLIHKRLIRLRKTKRPALAGLLVVFGKVYSRSNSSGYGELSLG